MIFGENAKYLDSEHGRFLCLEAADLSNMFTISPKIRYREQMHENSHALGFNGSGSSRKWGIKVQFREGGRETEGKGRRDSSNSWLGSSISDSRM